MDEKLGEFEINPDYVKISEQRLSQNTLNGI